MSELSPSLRDVDVIVTNFKRRYSGVMSTMVNLVPEQTKKLKLAVLGHRFKKDWPKVSWLSLFKHGWSKPSSGREYRIWHCRRNPEMLWGLILRDWLGMKLRLVFTSAAQRDHTAWTKMLLRGMDHVIATSPESGSYLKVPYTVNMHGVDTQTYRPAEDRSKLWEETGLGGKYAVGIFGRVRSQKGTDRFVEMMIDLLPSRKDWTAVIMGKIMASENEFVAQLKEKINEAGLDKQIIFMGEQPAEKVPFWLRCMSIVVGPQRNEGFGLVPAEAAASGAAVVACDAGAAKYLIKDGETGYFREINKALKEELSESEQARRNMHGMMSEVAPLKACLAQLMDDLERVEAFGKAGREFVLKDFSVEREAAGIQAIYEQVWREG